MDERAPEESVGSAMMDLAPWAKLLQAPNSRCG
jgi:hypothetical protein